LLRQISIKSKFKINQLSLDNDTGLQYHLNMNKKHRKTLDAIFSHPVSGNLEWRRIEALFVALGAEVIEGDFHRPHPGKEAKRYQLKNAKDFLIRAEITT